MLMQIREDLIPFAVLLIGGTMLVIITLIHGYGLDTIVGRYHKRAAGLRAESRKPRVAVLVFGGTIFLMLLLHIFEIWLWGGLLRGSGLVPNMDEAVYFSANTYTTLGMGSMVLPHKWHELSPIIAMAGLFTFAWTTSELFNIVGEQHELVADLAAERRSGSSKMASEKA